MPTPHRRIAVIEDPELSAAIDGARRELGEGRSKAAIVRDLAIRGWQGLEDDAGRQRRSAQGLMELLRDPEAVDWEALEELHRRDLEPR